MIDNSLILKCEQNLKDTFALVEEIALYNQEKVLNAFKKNQIALRHFVGTNGYGYGDEGRDTLNKLLADIFNTESAICSPNIASGTHALSLSLFALLRPNDTFISITGNPYDTLNDVINGENIGSLKDYGVSFETISLKDGRIDLEAVKNRLNGKNKPKMIYLQRSKGYDWRDALSINDIEIAVKTVRSCGFDGIIMVDNCYGAFIDKLEPTDVGVDVVAGSMIKNLGGGIAPTGGYIAGKQKYIDLIYGRLTAPSIGGEVGSYQSGYQYFYQGIFMAPHTVLQAVKGALLYSAVFSELGYEVYPKAYTLANDIICSIKLNDKDKLISFIQTVQANSPVDSHVLALPWAMPGYTEEVIMAAGCFVQGSSIELSADAPIKEPYVAYLQGGLTYEHCKIALKNMDL